MNYPATIHSPRGFDRCQPAGFDGVFDWSWTKGCFDSEGTISPMDFDGVIERNGQFIVFETKEPGKGLPNGQFRTLKAAHDTGFWTVMLIQGKAAPERGFIWWPGAKISRQNLGHPFTGLEQARGLVAAWYRNADTGAPF